MVVAPVLAVVRAWVLPKLTKADSIEAWVNDDTDSYKKDTQVAYGLQVFERSRILSSARRWAITTPHIPKTLKLYANRSLYC